MSMGMGGTLPAPENLTPEQHRERFAKRIVQGRLLDLCQHAERYPDLCDEIRRTVYPLIDSLGLPNRGY